MKMKSGVRILAFSLFHLLFWTFETCRDTHVDDQRYDRRWYGNLSGTVLTALSTKIYKVAQVNISA